LMILGEYLAPLQWGAILCVIAASVGSTVTGTPAVIHD
jgi:threonine/homoserine efflux transporter RhtA